MSIHCTFLVRILQLQGDICDGIYIIKKGTCVEEKAVHIKKSNRWPSGKNQWEIRDTDVVKNIIVKRIGPGRMVGETDCPHDRPRTFSLKAVDLVYAIFWSKNSKNCRRL